MSATEVRHPRGLRAIVFLWFPVLAPIGAWTVHLVFIASITRLSCTRPGTEWTIHAVTAVTLAVCAVALLLSRRLLHGRDDEGADSLGGRDLFLGRLGLYVGLFNVALIVLEELFAIGLHPVRCGG